jgi:N-acetyl-beta-hexosaminidase
MVGLVLTIVVSCTHRTEAPLSLHWELIANDVEPGICEAELTITNNTSQPVSNNGWMLGFGLMSLHPIYTEGEQLRETEVQASYHTIEPTEAFVPLAAGECRTYKLRYKGSAVRQSSHPEGFFLVREGKQPVDISCTYAPYTRKEQMTRGIATWDKTPYADGEYMYAYIERRLSDTLPHFVKWDEGNDPDFYNPSTAQSVLPILPVPKVYLKADAPHRPLGQLPRVEYFRGLPAESYIIEVTNDTVWIGYGDKAGLYYANLTIDQLAEDTYIQCISDSPDLHHRAMMLDIVRNYYPADSIRRVIDVMARLKLNVLHLHLSDDEGWRIEIPALPQLTANGSSRGYTTDEATCLYPFYCGGWDANDKHSTANGYLTREEYIQLVRYAGERYIRVIPEIDMPGHMRAMKKAMGDVLTDSVLESRQYLSAQNYTDNVIAVTRPETLPVMRTVIEAFVDMHNEAGYPLQVFNIGGDEVPKGALTREEHQTFINGVLDILKEHNLQPAGWEEMTHFCTPDSRAICYSWHNGLQKAQQMADDGYPVVLATANHLYFDFAYCHQHEEKGLNWGGYTDEFDAFDWQALTHKNVIGISAQLWAEVIRSFSQVEWQLYPKMFGLSERGWNYQDSPLSVSEYANLVYGKYLPMLAAEGKNFHLLQPGVHIQDGTARMNSIYPAGAISYTLEYADGHTEQATYSAPLELPEGVQLIKAQWRYLGHTSNTTWAPVKQE